MRRNILKTLTSALRRRKARPRRDDVQRTRVTTPRWARTHSIVHPEKDLSEWVSRVAHDDWDTVVKGRDKR